MTADKNQRRRPRGSAWHWKQTDCWYYTPPGTKRRVPLTDKEGKRIRGSENRQVAELALARVKVSGQWRPSAAPASEDSWIVATVCSKFIEHCDRTVLNDTRGREYRDAVVRFLNDLCGYCGQLPHPLE